MKKLIFTFSVIFIVPKSSFHLPDEVKDDLVVATCSLLLRSLLPHVVLFSHFCGDVVFIKDAA